MVGNKHYFSREGVTKMKRHVRCIISPRVSPSQRWHVVQHKNFPKAFQDLEEEDEWAKSS